VPEIGLSTWYRFSDNIFWTALVHFMLTPEQATYILTNAYVPEHIVGLMTSLSGGEPFLIDDYFCCCKGDWVIFIGYPLRHEFALDEFEAVLEKVKKKFRPAHISLIAPELSPRMDARCREKDSDTYYTLDTRLPTPGSAVRRNLKKAGRLLTVERAVHMGDAHHELMQEFIERVSPPLRVKELFVKMPQYIASARHAFVLNAWRYKKDLAAFYVVDLAAKDFANYIIGCYSKNNYVIGASDLLLSELIKLSSEHGKGYIHLGLGVSSGIRRFKEKWGARPTRSYKMCELVCKKAFILEVIRGFQRFGNCL
jgi:hypothetical protein